MRPSLNPSRGPSVSSGGLCRSSLGLKLWPQAPHGRARLKSQPARSAPPSAPESAPAEDASTLAAAVRGAIDSVPAVGQHPRAVRASIGGSNLRHDGSGGRFLLPLLDPEAQPVPFAMALELLEPEHVTCSKDPRQAPGVDLYELVYVLEGSGRVIGKDGSVEQLKAGDSMLMPVGHGCMIGASPLDADWVADVADGDGDASAELLEGRWRMATLRMLLPQALVMYPSVAGVESREAVAAEFRGWMNGMTETEPIPDQLVDSLLASAQRRAVATFETEGSDEPSTSDEGADPAPMRSQDAGDAPPLLVVGGLSLPIRMREAGQRASLAWTRGGRSRADDDAAATSAPGRADVDGDLADVAPWTAIARDATVRMLERWLPPVARDVVAAGGAARRIVKRRLAEVAARDMYQLPEQSNRLALFFDPSQADVPFTFGIEIFNPAHVTPPHTHRHAYELFFVLSGEGKGVCDGEWFDLGVGDTVVFPPGTEHGVNNAPDSKMYCLEMMLPNEMFAEFVKRGRKLHGLEKDDLCVLISQGCR